MIDSCLAFYVFVGFVVFSGLCWAYVGYEPHSAIFISTLRHRLLYTDYTTLLHPKANKRRKKTNYLSLMPTINNLELLTARYLQQLRLAVDNIAWLSVNLDSLSIALGLV